MEMLLEQLDIHKEENRPPIWPHTIYKAKFKWIWNLNIMAKTVKHLEKNIGEKFLWPWGRQKALGTRTQKVQIIKKINKMDFIKIESFCSLKDTVYAMKRQTADQEKQWICLKNIKFLQLNQWKSNLSNFLSGQNGFNCLY